MTESYKTIAGAAEHEIVIERSRFITYVERVTSEEEAQSFIQYIKKKHWNATHNCSAYVIGERDEIQKAHDDGEPSGTAGKPMLEVLKKIGVKNTVAVVTRYFGGIKLGAGGLIRAYGQATKEGIHAAGIVERVLHQELLITMDYTWHGKVLNELTALETIIADTAFTDQVTMTLHIPIGEEEKMKEFLTNLTNGQSEITLGQELYIEKLVTESAQED